MWLEAHHPGGRLGIRTLTTLAVAVLTVPGLIGAPIPGTAADGGAGHEQAPGTDVLLIAGGQTDDGGLNETQALIPGPDIWIDLADYPGPSLTAGTYTLYQNSIYVFGGGVEPSDRSYRYDLEDDAWERLADMPTPLKRLAHRTPAVDGHVYIPGGYDGSNRQDSFFAYDIRNDTWITDLPDAPDDKTYPYVWVDQADVLHFVAGSTSPGARTNDHWTYDPDERTWTEMGGTPYPIEVTDGDGSVYGFQDGDWWTMGGWNGGQRYQDVYVYRPSLGIWDQPTQLPEPWSHMGAASIDVEGEERLYVVGGKKEGSKSPVDDIAYYDGDWHEGTLSLDRAKHNIGIVESVRLGHVTLVDDDGTDCPDAPYAEIQKALDDADPGDMVLACEGEYSENLRLGEENLTLRGQDATLSPPGNAPGVRIDAANGTVEGFSIVDPAGPGIEASGEAEGALVLENEVEAATDGIVVRTGAHNTTLLRNDVHGNAGTGILVEPHVDGVEIHRNAIASNGGPKGKGGPGLFVGSGATGTATDNWWGSPIGPFPGSVNPPGPPENVIEEGVATTTPWCVDPGCR